MTYSDRLSLEGRTLLVTGAAAGIGAASARAAAARGARLLLVDLDEAGASALAAELGGGATARAIDAKVVGRDSCEHPQLRARAVDDGDGIAGQR